MAEFLHQLRLVVYPIIYRVSYMSGGCLGFLPSTVFSQDLFLEGNVSSGGCFLAAKQAAQVQHGI